jgi:hypothetical protein
MRIGVPSEHGQIERRVALTPDAVARLLPLVSTVLYSSGKLVMIVMICITNEQQIDRKNIFRSIVHRKIYISEFMGPPVDHSALNRA